MLIEFETDQTISTVFRKIVLDSARILGLEDHGDRVLVFLVLPCDSGPFHCVTVRGTLADVRKKWEEALGAKQGFPVAPSDCVQCAGCPPHPGTTCPLCGTHYDWLPEQTPPPGHRANPYWTVDCTAPGCDGQMTWQPSNDQYFCDICGHSPGGIHLGDMCMGCGKDITGGIADHECPKKHTPPSPVAGADAEATP